MRFRVRVAVMIMTMMSSWALGQSVVGIWHDPDIPRQAGHADPKFLMRLLEYCGFPVCFLSTNDLANPRVLTPRKISLVLLPYGAFFPADAVDNFHSYLKAGGRFISLGGYAFDEIFERDGKFGGEWRWERVAHERVQSSATQGKLRIAVPNDAPIDWHRLRAILPLRQGWRYLLKGKVRTNGIRDGYGAYLAADYYDADGNRISFQQTQIVQRTEGWRELGVVLKIPDNAARVAINAIVHGRGVAEFTDISVKPIINSRWGETRDWMHLDPDQLPIFDPSFRIDGATKLEWVIENGVAVQTEEPMKGYAAVGIIGSNNPVNPKAWARLVPVLIARDRFGRYLGPAFSILHHFAGPYSGGSWAFCGIESHDLTKLPGFRKVLMKVIHRLLSGVYLHSLKPSLWCYRVGERVQVSVQVRNDGFAPQTVTVRMEIMPMPQPLKMGEPIVRTERVVTLSPREQTTVTMGWEIPQSAAPLYAVRAFLTRPTRDELWSGFCVWDEKLLKQAKPIRWVDNTLQEWDGETWRPRFWLGTNQTGVMFAPEATWENPLQWEWEFALMRRMGLSVLRVLHISYFAGDLENPTENFWRRYDALVLMAHRHGLVLMPCLHDWMGVSVDEGTLQRQCAFVRLVGARYKDAPRILWDIENEAHVDIRDHPDLRRMFNEWLKERYGDEKELQRAWREPVELGNIPFEPHQPRSWDDLKFRDIQHFRRWLTERWVRANVKALRESGAKQPVTDEIDWKVCGDHFEASRWLTFVNLHYYGTRSPEAVATNLKFYERLHRKQGLAVGEFGARNHPSFRFGGWGYATSDEVVRHFITVPVLTLLSGGSMALNWDWKDMEACIFPWGLVHQHGVSATAKSQRHRTKGVEGLKVWQVEAALKTAGKAMAAVARLTQTIRFLPIEVMSVTKGAITLVVPDEHLLGAGGEVGVSSTGPKGSVSAAVFRAIEAMLRLKVPFLTVREWELKLVSSDEANCGIAIFPIPFTWKDETFNEVKRFVEKGGVAVITGNFAFDADRKGLRTERLKEFLGIEVIKNAFTPFDLDAIQSVRCVASNEKFTLREWQGKPCVVMESAPHSLEGVLAMTERGEPVVVARKVGKGWVVFCADAPEFRSVEETIRLYEALLLFAADLRGVKLEGVEWMLGWYLRFGLDTDLLMFSAGNGDKGWIIGVANPTEEVRLVHIPRHWVGGWMRLALPPKSSGILAVGTHEEPLASLFVGDFWGIGSGHRTQLLARANGLTFLWGEPPFSRIGTSDMRFIPLQPGEIHIRCTAPEVAVSVFDLLTGKLLLNCRAKARRNWLRFAVPPELVLTEWRVER